ncbi:MAG: MFS transporter [Desulfobacterales bacterium]|nr:MFS transporter [Desulfobacterales bacterium]
MRKKALPIYIFSFFMIMPLHAVLPVLPLIRDELQASYSEISFFVASIGIIRLVLAFPSGYLVDRFDKKKMLLFSGALSVTGLLLMSFSHSIYQLILSRIFIGTSSILCTITILVVLSELAGANSKAMMMSMNNVIHNAGGIIAPVFAGFLSGLHNWRLPFIVNAAFIGLSMVMIVLTVPSLKSTTANTIKEPGSKKNNLLPLGFGAEILRLIPVFGLSIFVFFYRSGLRHNLIPFYAKDVFHISTEALGFYISLTGMVAMISIFVSGHLADRYGRKAVLMPAVIVSALAAAALLLPEGLNPLLIACILVGTGAIINSMPNILITDIASPGSVGKLIGINRIFADSGYLVGSVSVGMILDSFGFSVPVYVIAGFAAVTLVMIAFFIHNKPVDLGAK